MMKNTRDASLARKANKLASLQLVFSLLILIPAFLFWAFGFHLIFFLFAEFVLLGFLFFIFKYFAFSSLSQLKQAAELENNLSAEANLNANKEKQKILIAETIHDMSSPLAVLELIIQSTHRPLPPESKQSLEGVASRFRKIIDNLREHY